MTRIPGSGPGAVWLDSRDPAGQQVYFAGPHDCAAVAEATRTAGATMRVAAVRIRPNPGRSRFRLSAPADVWDAAGRHCARITGAPGAPLEWDGFDLRGRPLATGRYWVTPLGQRGSKRHLLILR
ncbi:MAG: hypothetical protein GF330_10875 [Candidatus Eisenbacteria bacterium]|nr:hypothetical protein [Candidatus Eisenbacteria bacterium]